MFNVIVFFQIKYHFFFFKEIICINRYEKGQIYRIVNVRYNKCYFGSTCEGLKKRFERHRRCYNAYKDRRQQGFMSSFHLFNEFGVENCKLNGLKMLLVKAKRS